MSDACYRHDKINCPECFGGFNPPSRTPPADTSTAGEWNLMEGDLAVILTGGPVALAANAENAAAIVDAHNSSLAALREQLRRATEELSILRDDKGVDDSWRRQCDENERLEAENAKLEAALKQKDEALRLISDVVPHFQVAFSMPAGFPVSKQLPPQGYDVWLHDFIAGVIKVQPDSTALKTVIEAADSGSETLMPQGQQSEETGNA